MHVTEGPLVRTLQAVSQTQITRKVSKLTTLAKDLPEILSFVNVVVFAAIVMCRRPVFVRCFFDHWRT